MVHATRTCIALTMLIFARSGLVDAIGGEKFLDSAAHRSSTTREEELAALQVDKIKNVLTNLGERLSPPDKQTRQEASTISSEQQRPPLDQQKVAGEEPPGFLGSRT